MFSLTSFVVGEVSLVLANKASRFEIALENNWRYLQIFNVHLTKKLQRLLSASWSDLSIAAIAHP